MTISRKSKEAIKTALAIKEIRQIARATINDDREKISLRIPKSDLSAHQITCIA